MAAHALTQAGAWGEDRGMRPIRIVSTLASLVLFLASGMPGFAQTSPEAFLPRTGGLLWSRSETAGGLSQVMKAEESILSPDRSTWTLVDDITVDKASSLGAWFSGFSVSYREDVLRGQIEESGFSIEAKALQAGFVLEPRFDLVLPWGRESIEAEYTRASGGPKDSLVLRYKLFKLRYALAGIEKLAATQGIEALDKQRVSLKLYSDRGTLSIDMPLAWYLELYRKLKTRY